MRTVLFNNVAAVPAANATHDWPSTVAEATIAAFDPDDMAAGTLNLGAALSGQRANAVKRVVFVQGAENGESIQLPAIEWRTIEHVRNVTYVAPTAQATTITPNFTTGTGVVTVRVIRTDTGFKPDQIFNSQVSITGLTREQFVDALVVSLNKKVGKFYTASRGSTGNTSTLIITGDLGVSFQTSLDDSAVLWTKSTVAPNFGTGTEQMLKDLEEQAWGSNVTNRIYLPILPKRYASGNYDIYNFQARTSTSPEISKSNQYIDVTLAVRTPSTGINLVTFFS